MFCIYTRLVFCISIQFSNTGVTLRNESRQILECLMHFCSSSCYVMWQPFSSLSNLHILVSIFGIAFWFFQQHFFLTFQHRLGLHLFQVSGPFARFFVVVLLQFLGLCHVLCSSILGLCICYLTTNNFMLTFCIYEIWDTIFIQFIDIFTTLFQQFLIVFHKNTSSKIVKYIC